MNKLMYRIYHKRHKIDEFKKLASWPFIWTIGTRIKRRIVFYGHKHWLQVTKISSRWGDYNGIIRIYVKFLDKKTEKTLNNTGR